jgi:hypothetical protein
MLLMCLLNGFTLPFRQNTGSRIPSYSFPELSGLRSLI